MPQVYASGMQPRLAGLIALICMSALHGAAMAESVLNHEKWVYTGVTEGEVRACVGGFATIASQVTAEVPILCIDADVHSDLVSFTLNNDLRRCKGPSAQLCELYVQVDGRQPRLAIGLYGNGSGPKRPDVFLARYKTKTRSDDDLVTDVLLAEHVRIGLIAGGTDCAMMFNLKGLDFDRLHAMRHGLTK